MFELIFFPMLPGILLVASMIWFLWVERAEKARLVREKDLSLDQRLPCHYRSFSDVEKTLWLATQEYVKEIAWENARLDLRAPELKIVEAYLRGLKEDFERGNRVFCAVIRHSPSADLLARLEWQRTRLRILFCFRCGVAALRLRTGRISVSELRRTTDVVRDLAYQVRTMVHIFEQSGNREFIESILKNG